MTDSSIYPCLWFDGKAKEAATFYCSVFQRNSKIISETPMVVMFELTGKKFMGLNGGPMYKFSEAVSFVIDCKDQDEVDYFWSKLTADGGEPGRCGWLKDKYGCSWQVVPAALPRLMSNPDSAKSQAVMQAFMKMSKFDIAALEAAGM